MSSTPIAETAAYLTAVIAKGLTQPMEMMEMGDAEASPTPTAEIAVDPAMVTAVGLMQMLNTTVTVIFSLVNSMGLLVAEFTAVKQTLTDDDIYMIVSLLQSVYPLLLANLSIDEAFLSGSSYVPRILQNILK